MILAWASPFKAIVPVNIKVNIRSYDFTLVDFSFLKHIRYG